MWAVLVCISAFFNSLWTALIQQRVRGISAISFAIVFRALTALFLLPLFIYGFQVPTEPLFWAALAASGLREAVQVVLLSAGVRRDYYATYSMYNTAPLFLILLGPTVLPERLTLALLVGAAMIVTGGLTFYRIGGFSVYGLVCALLSAVGTILNKIALGFCSWFFYPFLLFVIASSALLPWGLRRHRGQDLRTTWRRAGRLAPLALFSCLAAVGYFSALQIAPATRVGLLWRSNLLFGFFISYFLLRERADWQHRLAGGALIMAGCVLVSLS